MNEQADLFSSPPAATGKTIPEQDLAALRYALEFAGTWLTRAELCQKLDWNERHLRFVAEALGSDVVRCQKGFKLTHLVTRDDVPAILQGLDGLHSQAAKMDAYVLSVRKRIHSLVG